MIGRVDPGCDRARVVGTMRSSLATLPTIPLYAIGSKEVGCDKLPNGETFYTLTEAEIMIDAVAASLQHGQTPFSAGPQVSRTGGRRGQSRERLRPLGNNDKTRQLEHISIGSLQWSLSYCLWSASKSLQQPVF